MHTPYTRNGVTTQALQVGRYMVMGCCPRPDNPHAVIHTPSNESVICGLTQEVAVLVADAVSLYAPDYPSVFGGLGPELTQWLDEIYEGSAEAYVTFHERVYGRRPQPWTFAVWPSADPFPGFRKMPSN